MLLALLLNNDELTICGVLCNHACFAAGVGVVVVGVVLVIYIFAFAHPYIKVTKMQNKLY